MTMRTAAEAMNQPLPAYKSHKVVEAIKLAGIEVSTDAHVPTVVHPDKSECMGPFTLPGAWAINKGIPQDGSDPGYIVRYEDGYVSWSPTRAFEAGYTRIQYGSDEPNYNAESLEAADKIMRLTTADLTEGPGQLKANIQIAVRQAIHQAMKGR